VSAPAPVSLRRRAPLDGLALWILWSAWCSLSGWGLSCLGLLDRTGYIVSLLVFLVAFLWLRADLREALPRPIFLFRRGTYRRHLLPKLWLATALLALAGGLLYHPDNYDYLTYRFPRVLHWAWEHRWYWIDTPNDRQNLSATGMEWLMAPLFVLFQTDRLFFTINVVSYFLLPGLIFSVLRGLGVSGRVCWWWMWILPTGFCFALQAASMGNDMFAVVYMLAAFHYILRAGRESSPWHLPLSLLGIALMTGTKASNVPLGAVWLAVLWLRRKSLGPTLRPLPLLAALGVGVIVSFLPVALLNIHFTGDYTGDPTNHHGVKLANPVAGLIGNSLEIVVENLAPPVWTHELDWNSFQPALKNYLAKDYPRFGISAEPFQIEEVAGIGLGVSLFILVAAAYGFRDRVMRPSGWRGARLEDAWLIFAAAAIASLVYLAKMGSEAAPRLFAPYYVVIVMGVALLLPVEGPVIHRPLWKGTGFFAVLMIFPLLLLSPSRPLLPTALVDRAFKLAHLPTAALVKLNQAYFVRAQRFDNLAELRRRIPAGEPAIGFLAGGDDPAVSPWLPFGSKKVVDVTPATTADDLRAENVRYVLVSDAALANRYKDRVHDLETKWSMTVIAQSNLIFKTHEGFNVWYLLRAN
jgi:hypothetical protein